MKLSKHAWTIWGILLVVALVLMVLIPFSRTASWWIAAICTVLMFLLAAWTFYAAFRKDGLESKILGWPIFKLGAVALAVQVVLGFALMGLAALCPAWVTVLAEVLIFAVTGICLTVKDAARVVVSQSEAHMADSTAAWKVIRQKANALSASGDADMKRLAEEIRFADPMPTSIDGEIAAQVDALAAGKNPDAIKRLTAALAQRKVIAKQEKAGK